VGAELSSAGRLWAWTAVTSAPPGYKGEVPFGFGVVELPEGLRVIGRLTEARPDHLTRDQPMHLVLVTLPADEDRLVVTYAFAPTVDTGGAAAAPGPGPGPTAGATA
jgi:uncharacterized OB-fold protein